MARAKEAVCLFSPRGPRREEAGRSSVRRKSPQLTGPRPHFLDHCSQFSHTLPLFLTHPLSVSPGVATGGGGRPVGLRCPEQGEAMSEASGSLLFTWLPRRLGGAFWKTEPCI